MEGVAGPASTLVLVPLLVIVGLLLISAYLAAGEIGFLAVGQTRLRHLSEQGSRAARLLLFFHKRRAWVLAVILLGITSSHYFAEHFATVLGIRLLGPTAGPLVAVLLITVVVLIFCEVLPIQFALRRPERVALRVATPIGVLSLLLSPVVLLLSGAAKALLWLTGTPGSSLEPRLTEEQLRAMIEQGEEAGVIPAGQRLMLHSVLDFGETTVAEVMVPRMDMVCVEAEQPLSEVLRLGVEHRHSRFPVYEGSVDNIVGVVFLKDLLPYVRSGQMEPPCRVVARSAHHVPESLALDELLRQLQARRQLMAIVKDEFGGTAGLVTVEDALEEVVGDIFDEHDKSVPQVQVLGENELLCDAVISLRALQDYVDEELPVEEYDSVGGMLMGLAGHVPQVGEQLSWERLEFIVEEAEGPRLGMIRVIEHVVPPAGEPHV